ncbi:type IV secretion system protein VirB8 [Sphingomonas leidyi]|uniref:Type IV secretion system protein VirB8 n=1 Tax=Sphingomonas leidyi TaxID=68569 RepID=A0A7X5ZWM9_9SPHN|nr:VirB8/TrbF family protein [Sphingomonas leidyi]NIJ65954.1 type IV secretion system protein VirB8 [Sphingomonas leidyi]
MKNKAREALDAYYREAGSWAEDSQAALRGSQRTAWIVAGVACAIALMEAAALLALTPLKTVEPYTLLVDRQTGYVQALKPLDAQQVSANAALTQSFLVQYVIARESFDATALQSNYRKVSLWSAGEARNAYVAGMQASNPDSPLVRLARTSVVETRVKSVSPLGKNAALVRFETAQRDANGTVQAPRAWVSVIRYRYSGEPMSLEDRFVNPLGFEVTQYQRNAEALPPAEPVATAPAASPGPAPSSSTGSLPGPAPR